MMKDVNRILSFDLLRIIAIIGVIIIHVSYTCFYLLNTNPFAWWITNVLFALTRWAVPIFFMISGALILAKKEAIAVIYKKRLSNILIPFAFWNVVYAYFDATHNSSHRFYKVLLSSLSGPIIYHLWFIYALVALYIISPILCVLVQNARRIVLEYYIVICFLASSVIPLINRFFDFKIALIIPFADGYVIYFILGYYLFTYRFSFRLKLTFYILGIISVLFIILATYLLTYTTGKYNEYFHTYLTFPIIFSSIAVYIYFLDFKLSKQGFISHLGKRINISRICYGIYLSHLSIIGILSGGKLGFTLHATTLNPLFGITITTLVVFFTSFTSFYILEVFKRNFFIKSISRFVY